MNGVVGSSRYPVVADDLVIFPDWDPAPSPGRDADRVLRAFDAATGIEQWTVTFDSPPEGRAYLTPPTVTADSHIVVGVIDRQTGREAGALRAYTMEGDLVWETEGIWSGTPTYDGDDDALYAGSGTAIEGNNLLRPVYRTTGVVGIAGVKVAVVATGVTLFRVVVSRRWAKWMMGWFYAACGTAWTIAGGWIDVETFVSA